MPIILRKIDMQTTIHNAAPPLMPNFDVLGRAQLGPTTSQRMQDLFSISGRFPGEAVQAGIDKLENAFSAMQAHGILTRHDYSCCSTCGSAEIRDEVSKACQSGLSVDGFVFYSWDAADTASESGQLSLTFASRLGANTSVADIGHLAQRCLREAGLQTVWNGDPAGRILVTLAEQ
jgi:hypothetical protein